jgi:hypothetical protein
MQNSQKKVLQFPKPLEEPGAQPIICQIGADRFAIHYRIEDLPPAATPAGVEARSQEGHDENHKVVPDRDSRQHTGLAISHEQRDECVDRRHTTCKWKQSTFAFQPR